MRIYLEHEGEELGPYGRERVLHGVRTGKWPASTRARAEESREWSTLGELLAGELNPRPKPSAATAAPAPPVKRPKPSEGPPTRSRPPLKAFLLLFLIGVLVYLYTMNREPKEPVRSFETDPPEWMASPRLPVPKVLPPVSPTASPSPSLVLEDGDQPTDSADEDLSRFVD